MSGDPRRSKWLRRLAQVGLFAGVVLGLGATPGCMCRSRGYLPGRRVVYTRPARVYSRPVVRRPMVGVSPGPRVRVGAPVARPVARPRRR